MICSAGFAFCDDDFRDIGRCGYLKPIGKQRAYSQHLSVY